MNISLYNGYSQGRPGKEFQAVKYYSSKQHICQYLIVIMYTT